MSKSPQDVLRQIKDEGIELIDLKFTDLHGKWQHLTVCTDLLEEESFTEGLAFDGSSIRGWKGIQASDMAMVPDANTAWVDPFYRHKTLSMICSIQEPRTGQPYERCPRALAQRALNHLASTGLADMAFFGPEPEFFLFDDVRYNSAEGGSSFYSVDTIEAAWNTGRIEEGGNLAYKIQEKEGYFPVAPNDTAQDIRSEMLLHHGSAGHPHGEAPPRGGHRGPTRARHEIRRADPGGRQRDDVQVRRAQRSQEIRQDRHVHAQAGLQRQRQRYARAPEPLEGRTAPVLRRRHLRQPFADRPLVHRRPAQARPRASWPSPTPPPTATSAWCPASKPR